ESTLYVIGRAPNQPYRYYWRSCARFGTEEMAWSGWEALDADGANDFIQPFVFEGDLHVAWPVFRKTRSEMAARHDSKVPDSSLEALQWEVQIAWSRRSAQGWAKRKLSHDVLTLPRLFGISQLRSFVLRLRQDAPPLPMATTLREDRIKIDCYAANDLMKHTPPVEENRDGPTPEGGSGQGLQNIEFKLNGQVAERYQVNGQWIYRASPNVAVKFEYHHKDTEQLQPYYCCELQ